MLSFICLFLFPVLLASAFYILYPSLLLFDQIERPFSWFSPFVVCLFSLYNTFLFCNGGLAHITLAQSCFLEQLSVALTLS